MWCNCIFYVVWMRLNFGGQIRWHRSRTWSGFHATWVDPNGIEWEYTLAKPRKQPWWYIPFCYQGVIKEVHIRS